LQRFVPVYYAVFNVVLHNNEYEKTVIPGADNAITERQSAVATRRAASSADVDANDAGDGGRRRRRAQSCCQSCCHQGNAWVLLLLFLCC
jgi:hypothetical protein